ncbi:MAG: ABC transporter ATP-binding protein [Verrucomicrobiales bacterium]|jgi:ABC-2 type transport system ATP-binding protein|nr:ABC transporter ATP-binding protein [Verrucomicrobiales bacterium]MDR1305051.1 ABC transporter ATP-binding protein [Verrucomicrobiales bacterium]
MSELIVEIQNLRKTFGALVAIDDLTFSVARGEIVGLLGANGAGKTTALSILLGLVTPSAGSVRVFGQDLERHRVAVLRRMNFSSAYTALPSNLRVEENLLVFARLYSVQKPRRKIDELLELLEIAHLKKRVVGRLSSGESARVSLCKSLLNDPELLLLDEPTASLDPDIADKVRKWLRQVQRERGIGMIYTSHNMRDVEEVCDRVLFMRRGKIFAEGTPRSIVEKFQEQSLESLFIKVARGGDIEDL